MSIIRRNKFDYFDELIRLQNEMNDLFNLTYGGYANTGNGLLDRSYGPAIDMYESKDDFIVRADLPGFQKENIEVMVENDTLSIKGAREEDERNKEENYIRVERVAGVFSRVISLPAPVDSNKVTATYKDGVLELVLPKKEEAKPKQITINVE